MARVGDPVMMRIALSLFVENSHPETRHQGVMFRSPWAFVGVAALRNLPLVLKAVDGCGDAAAAVDEGITGESIHGHDGRVA